MYGSHAKRRHGKQTSSFKSKNKNCSLQIDSRATEHRRAQKTVARNGCVTRNERCQLLRDRPHLQSKGVQGPRRWMDRQEENKKSLSRKQLGLEDAEVSAAACLSVTTVPLRNQNTSHAGGHSES